VIRDRDAIAELLPHAGSMCLIDSVLHWDAQHIGCGSERHHAPDNPLRSSDRLSAIHGIEFGAQAMALHGALLAGGRASAGFGWLASVRDCRFHCERLDTLTGPLEISAYRLAQVGNALSYRFAVSAEGRVAVEGSAVVLLQAKGMP